MSGLPVAYSAGGKGKIKEVLGGVWRKQAETMRGYCYQLQITGLYQMKWSPIYQRGGHKKDIVQGGEMEVLFQETWKDKQLQQFESRIQDNIFYMLTCDEILEKSQEMSQLIVR